jgi:ethanolamine utilization protein EutQ (cupin superfamily)
MVDGVQPGGGFSLVAQPMPLARWMRRWTGHTREDEYSYVLEGRVGALFGEEVVSGEPGDLIFKPRGRWHAFWKSEVRRRSTPHAR